MDESKVPLHEGHIRKATTAGRDECSTGGQTESSCLVSQRFHCYGCGPGQHGVLLDYYLSRCFDPCPLPLPSPVHSQQSN